MRYCLLLSSIILLSSSSCKTTTEAEAVIDAFLTEHNGFKTPADTWGNYTLDLAIEGMIIYMENAGERRYESAIERFFNGRNYRFGDTVSFTGHPFTDCYFRWFEYTHDSTFIAPFIFESHRMMNELPRSPEGAICLPQAGSENLLIDYLQSYCSRMARAGHLSGDTAFFGECVRQFELYSELVRYPGSGLYSQGRGWLGDTMALSPSCWSRGQGWLIRGMVESLEYLPVGSPYSRRLTYLLQQFADALLSVQDENGMWHTLPCLTDIQSEPEVSGTALISYALLLASRKGFLEDPMYRRSGMKGVERVKRYIDAEGSIHNVSPGPGPLTSIAEYMNKGETNNEHGTGTVLLALAME